LGDHAWLDTGDHIKKMMLHVEGLFWHLDFPLFQVKRIGQKHSFDVCVAMPKSVV
jgi:hypothetical protein